MVPAGSFMMGSPSNEPERHEDEVQVQVRIAKPFAVGTLRGHLAEWDDCVVNGGCNDYRPGGGPLLRDRRPVNDVHWDDAKAFSSWLSKKTGKPYRLLSESEREYIARAGTTTPFWWGSTITPSQANYNGIDTYQRRWSQRRVPAADRGGG